MYTVLVGLVFVLALSSCTASDFCFTSDGYEYCDYGCCSDSCCGLSTMAIVGFVIGGVLALAGIVGCIICLACMCKQSNRHATPVHPMHNNNSVYVNHTPYHPPPRNPPGYNQYNSYPANSFGGDPAYPPGSAHPPPSYSSQDYK